MSDERMDSIVRPGGWPRASLGGLLCLLGVVAALGLLVGDWYGWHVIRAGGIAALMFGNIFLLLPLLFLCLVVVMAGADLVKKALR